MNLLVISGGRHPYAESTPVLESFLKGAGHSVTVTEHASVLADSSAMSGYDALVFNTRRENVPDFGDWALAKNEQEGLKNYVSGGKGFVCLHISTCLSTTWPEYHDIVGGALRPALTAAVTHDLPLTRPRNRMLHHHTTCLEPSRKIYG